MPKTYVINTLTSTSNPRRLRGEPSMVLRSSSSRDCLTEDATPFPQVLSETRRICNVRYTSF